MMSTSPLTAHQIVGCIGTGRPPTSAEEADLAARIWTEIGRDRTRQMWSQLAPAAWDRLMAFRAEGRAAWGGGSDLTLVGSEPSRRGPQRCRPIGTPLARRAPERWR